MEHTVATLFSVSFKSAGFLFPLAGFLFAVAAFLLSLRGNALLAEKGRRRLLAAFRAGALFTLVVCLIQPVLSVKKGEREKQRLDVLVDASPSMTRENGLWPRSVDYLRAHKNELDALSAKYDLRFLFFSADSCTDTLAGRATACLTRWRDISDLSAALNVVAEQRTPAGIVLLSDGLFQDKLSSRARLGLIPLEPEDGCAGVPFFPLLFDSAAARADIAITALSADEFAYAKNPFTLRVNLRASGLKEMTVPVNVMQGTEVAATGEVRLKKGTTDYTVTIDMAPEKPGHFIYTVSVPSYAGERNTANNRKAFALKVIRDRIRVLQVCGRPSWDERFLRQTLKKDPAVDLIAFYILRTVSDVVDGGNDELSLIEFPYQQLFDQEISSFDLVLFQNFSYRQFFSDYYLERVRRYVEAGGGFFILGGDLSFAEGGYRGTAIEPLLPFALEGDAHTLSQETGVRRTPEGETHPITSEAGEIESFRFEGQNRVGAARPGSQTLLRTTTGDPFFAVWETGRGRTAALASDGLWQFSFVNMDRGNGNRVSQELLRRTVRWLIRDPSLGTLSLRGLRTVYPAVAPVAFSLKAAAGGGSRSAEVRLIDERGRIAAVQRITLQGDTPTPVEFKGVGEGLYLVRADLTKKGVVQESVTESFSVSAVGEFGGGGVNGELLRALAASSGGKILRPDMDLFKAVDVPSETVRRILDRRDYPLWNSLPWIVLAVLLFSAEWFLRKRWGLP
ncbi:MAG: glutamine amidotransferase [Fibrobacterota bacterium]